MLSFGYFSRVLAILQVLSVLMVSRSSDIDNFNWIFVAAMSC
jgi:hypothetical protein